MIAMITLSFGIIMPTEAEALPPGTIVEEAQVPQYTLPDPLKMNDGTLVTDAATWQTKRRAEVLELFRTYVYGHSPAKPESMTWNVVSTDTGALGGKATRKEITIVPCDPLPVPSIHLLLYIPNGVQQPVPAILGLNFEGNHTVHSDPGITITENWVPPKAKGVVDGRPTEFSRGASTGRWAVEYLISRGYALATVYCGDLEPDHPQGWRDGIRGRISAEGKLLPAPDKKATSETSSPNAGHPDFAKPDDWGGIAAWAWGLSRAMDYLVTDSAINPKQVVVFGHSRLGKTALWAGAEDERFAIVISNNSGEGGAAIARRRFGERTADLNSRFPHWFCGNYQRYSNHEDDLPVDAHELIALVAPRPVYVASAAEDLWADPRGEFLACLHAEPVYKLFGLPGLGTSEWPAVDTPVGNTIGYHVRTGKHDVLEYDWARYLDFADRHFGW
jgi:hypothetical protein